MTSYTSGLATINKILHNINYIRVKNSIYLSIKVATLLKLLCCFNKR